MIRSCSKFLGHGLPVLLLALVVAGCAAPAGPAASSGASSDDPAPAYPDFIGEPVRSFDYSQLVDWHELDRDWIWVRVNRNRFFAIELMQPCIADAREAVGLTLMPGSPNRLTTADRVILRGRDCRIASIAPFDHAGWRRAIVTDR
ncbi:DUF6491 family protein [Halomonas denitrificans]|nr:hypothetical protein [Halomonas denitrificans]